MNRLNEMVAYNKKFVENKGYETYRTEKYPNKKTVILSCMDTRLTHLLPEALNLKNGDVKIVKNAGAVIMHPFGSIMRSIIVAIYELKTDEVIVIGHHGCGMNSVNSSAMADKMIDAGISKETLATIKYSGIDLDDWLHGFDCVEDSVKETVDSIKNHPLIPKSVAVHGLIMDPVTGGVDVVVNGYC